MNRVDLGEASAAPVIHWRTSGTALWPTDLVIGTLRWRGAIDFQIQRLARNGLSRLDGEVLDALRLGVYQILLSRTNAGQRRRK